MKIGNFFPESLVGKFGSPLYVYDADLIRTKCREFTKNFPEVKFYYACKANTNPEILKIIFKEGFGIETVSPGEIKIAKRIGEPVSKITFTCSSIDEKEIVWVAKQGVRIHLDSLAQAEFFGRHFPGGEISLRINNGVGAGHHAHVITGGPESKFGIDVAELKKLEKITNKYRLRITGLHQHIGSNILETPIFLKAVDSFIKIAFRFPYLKNLDFGGGFGIPYKPNEQPMALGYLGKKFKERLARFLKQAGRKVAVSFEPGRYLVAEAGNLLVKVTDIKSNSKRTFVGVNSGFNHLIRPAFYGAYHKIVNGSHPNGKPKKVTIAGNVCESGDIFAKDRLIPKPEIGDILVIKNAGAYGYTMSSDYNLRPKPVEVLVSKNKIRLITKAKTIY